MRHLRNWFSGSGFRLVQQDSSQYTDTPEPGGSDYTNVVHLDRSRLHREFGTTSASPSSGRAAAVPEPQ